MLLCPSDVPRLTQKPVNAVPSLSSVSTRSFIKGSFSNAKTGKSFGQYVGLASESTAGVGAIRIGDGYHNYLQVAIVSCSCTGLLGPQQSVIGATLKLRTTRIDGRNPFNRFPVRLKTDLVSDTVIPVSCVLLRFGRY